MKPYAIILCIVVLYAKASACQDSTTVAASKHYITRSFNRKLFIGKNYRATWALPVKMPVLDISKENGGMTIVKLGGRQTKSLYLRDKDSTDWVLRSVDKSFEKSMTPFVKKTFLKRWVQDMVSASYPYGALIAASLAKALLIPAPQPKLFYVPNDPAFGEYRQAFAHTVCMLERTDPTFDNSPAEISDTVLNKIKASNKYRIDDTTYLKVRLLDMLIADWDRHKDQLKWGIRKYNTDTIFYPIPRDRDQAFYHSTGLAMILGRAFGKKDMTGFTNSTKGLKYLNHKSWELDKLILHDMDEKEWRRIILEFRQTMTDAVLLSAVNALPPEVYQKDGQMIFEKLKARRNGLLKDAMKYREFISKI